MRNLEARPCIDALSCTNGTAHDEFTDEVMMMITATSATATADNSNKREEEEEGTTKVLHKTDLKTATEGQGPTSAKRNKGSSSGGRTRIAAHEFRQKQKLYIYSLEKRVAELTAVNSEMQSRLNLMCNENTIIKEHLAYLRGFIAQAVPGAEQDVCTMTGMAPNPQGNENEMNDDK